MEVDSALFIQVDDDRRSSSASAARHFSRGPSPAGGVGLRVHFTDGEADTDPVVARAGSAGRQRPLSPGRQRQPPSPAKFSLMRSSSPTGKLGRHGSSNSLLGGGGGVGRRDSAQSAMSQGAISTFSGVTTLSRISGMTGMRSVVGAAPGAAFDEAFFKNLIMGRIGAFSAAAGGLAQHDARIAAIDRDAEEVQRRQAESIVQQAREVDHAGAEWDATGYCPRAHSLLSAAGRGALSGIRRLLRAREPINCVDAAGRSVLMLCAGGGGIMRKTVVPRRFLQRPKHAVEGVGALGGAGKKKARAEVTSGAGAGVAGARVLRSGAAAPAAVATANAATTTESAVASAAAPAPSAVEEKKVEGWAPPKPKKKREEPQPPEEAILPPTVEEIAAAAAEAAAAAAAAAVQEKLKRKQAATAAAKAVRMRAQSKYCSGGEELETEIFVNCCRYLLQACPRARKSDFLAMCTPIGTTALHVAAAAGRTATVRLLLEAGAAADALDSSGASAADHAERGDFEALVLELRKHETAVAAAMAATVNTPLSPTGRQQAQRPGGGSERGKRAALSVRERQRQRQARLEAEGAAAEAARARDNERLNAERRDNGAATWGGGGVGTAADEDKFEGGENVLCMAALRGDLQAVRVLVRGGADISVTVDSWRRGANALYIAARGGQHGGNNELEADGHVGTVRYLLKACPPEHLDEMMNRQMVQRRGFTPLFAAAVEGRLKTVRLLLAAGADPLVRDEHGATAARWAHRRGWPHVVRELRKAADELSTGSIVASTDKQNKRSSKASNVGFSLLSTAGHATGASDDVLTFGELPMPP